MLACVSKRERERERDGEIPFDFCNRVPASEKPVEIFDATSTQDKVRVDEREREKERVREGVGEREGGREREREGGREKRGTSSSTLSVGKKRKNFSAGFFCSGQTVRIEPSTGIVFRCFECFGFFRPKTRILSTFYLPLLRLTVFQSILKRGT